MIVDSDQQVVNKKNLSGHRVPASEVGGPSEPMLTRGSPPKSKLPCNIRGLHFVAYDLGHEPFVAYNLGNLV